VVLLYRPLYLKYRALVTMETFSILSNVVIDSPVSLLRFVSLVTYLSVTTNLVIYTK